MPDSKLVLRKDGGYVIHQDPITGQDTNEDFLQIFKDAYAAIGLQPDSRPENDCTATFSSIALDNGIAYDVLFAFKSGAVSRFQVTASNDPSNVGITISLTHDSVPTGFARSGVQWSDTTTLYSPQPTDARWELTTYADKRPPGSYPKVRRTSERPTEFPKWAESGLKAIREAMPSAAQSNIPTLLRSLERTKDIRPSFTASAIALLNHNLDKWNLPTIPTQAVRQSKTPEAG